MQQNAANPAKSNSIFEEVKICFAKKEGIKRKTFLAQSLGRKSFI